MDSLSRQILWLEVNSTNKNPSIVASHNLNVVLRLEGVPRPIVTDERKIQLWGTFNSFFDSMIPMIAQEVLVFSREKVEETNVKKLARWSKFGEGGGGWSMSLFKDLRDAGF